VEYIGEHAAAVLSDIKHHLCEASAFSGAPSNVMDVLDKNKMQGYYLVMENTSIHTPAKVRAC
jgi:hypothetical protein